MLEPIVQEGFQTPDAIITWFDEDRLEQIQVPTKMPKHISRQTRKTRVPSEQHAAEIADEDLAFMKRRILQLVRDKLHPSAYFSSQDFQHVRSSTFGIKLNYTDRAESCYSGICHRGIQNFRCWVDDQDTIWAKCFGKPCDKHAYELGPLQDDLNQYAADAVTIDSPYLNRDLDIILHQMPQQLDEAIQAENSAVKFNLVVSNWIQGEFQALCLRSSMGTGMQSLSAPNARVGCFLLRITGCFPAQHLKH